MQVGHLDLRKRHLLGHEMNRMMISKLNQALQTHSTKKKASWALVWALSSVLKIKQNVIINLNVKSFKLLVGVIYNENITDQILLCR